jgi:hypothetical protein
MAGRGFTLACFFMARHNTPASRCHPERSEGSLLPGRNVHQGRRSFAALRMTERAQDDMQKGIVMA